MAIAPPAAAGDLPHAISTPRRPRLLGALRDALDLLPMLVVATALAVGWLLLRTAWGRDDARDLDSAVALAILGGAPAGWIARAAISLVTARATPGQRRHGLHLEAGRRAVGPWLALHPLFGSVAWAWLAGIAALATALTAALLLLAVALLVAAGGLVSLALVVLTEDPRTLHDRITGAHVVTA